jgi:hypothetical protein
VTITHVAEKKIVAVLRLTPTKVTVKLSQACGNDDASTQALGEYVLKSELAALSTCYFAGTGYRSEILVDPPSYGTGDREGSAIVKQKATDLKIDSDPSRVWTMKSNKLKEQTVYYVTPTVLGPGKADIPVVAALIEASATFPSQVCFSAYKGWTDDVPLKDFVIVPERGPTLKEGAGIVWNYQEENGASRYCAFRAEESALEGIYPMIKQGLRQPGQSFRVQIKFRQQQIARYILKDSTIKSFSAGYLVHRDKIVKRVSAGVPIIKWVDEICLVPERSTAEKSIDVDVSQLTVADETRKVHLSFENAVVQFRRNTDASAPQELKGSYCASFTTDSGTGPTGFKVKTKSESVSKAISVVWGGETLLQPEVSYDNWYFIFPGDALRESHIAAGVYAPIRPAVKTSAAPDSAYWVRGQFPLLGFFFGSPDVASGNIHFLGLGPGVFGAGAESGTIAGLAAGVYSSLCFRVETSFQPRACVSINADGMIINNSDGITAAAQVGYGFSIGGSLK